MTSDHFQQASVKWGLHSKLKFECFCLVSRTLSSLLSVTPRYRTQLCNDGVACRRKVCFFAHTLDELRVSSVKVLPAELGGRLPAPEADPFRNTGHSNNTGKYDRDRRMSTPAAPRSGTSDLRGGLGLSAGQQHSPIVSPISPLTSNLFDSVGGVSNDIVPSSLRGSNVRHSASNGNTSTSPAPASQSCGQVHFGANINSGKGFNAPKVPSMQQQQQEWFDSGAASVLVPELQALLRGHQQHGSSNGGAPSMAPSTSPGMDLMQMAQLQQLAAAQAQIQAIHAQQHQQVGLFAPWSQFLCGVFQMNDVVDTAGVFRLTVSVQVSCKRDCSWQLCSTKPCAKSASDRGMWFNTRMSGRQGIVNARNSYPRLTGPVFISGLVTDSL